MLAERGGKRSAAARLPAVRIRRQSLVLLLALGLLAVPAAAPAAPAQPSVPACALGTSAADLRGFFASELARAERRFAKGPAARREFASAAAAYVYGLAPVAIRATTQRFLENQLVSIAALTDPSVRTVVLPNHDTTYTVGTLQLAAGPRVLDVPDTRGRYYVIQLLDAYSNTFAYVGRRTTGTKAGSYVVVPPGFKGTLPAGVKRIQSPTNRVWVLGRTLLRDAADLPAVGQLMGGYKITALDGWTAGERQGSLVFDSFPTLAPVVLPTGVDFYAQLGEILAADPAPKRDACALRAFARAGIGPGKAPKGKALAAAARAGARIVGRAEQRANRFGARRNNGWVLPGPYVGAYARNYLGRAVIATAALGANTRPETVYPLAVADVAGRPLSGSHRYVVRFPRGELPPADAFWSLTMYGEDRYLVPNPIDRYAIGDRTKGLHRGPDGSLTLYIQHNRPSRAASANWLPAPKGRFRLALRIYEPRQSVLTGGWLPPPVRRR
ncbi:MAG: hypothetical protein QOD71_2884 [Thermoleophilaceae bacterium]|jgi:hypothetical protein|nr:hypothetical protein [Thermoleophilaceae bacterium]